MAEKSFAAGSRQDFGRLHSKSLFKCESRAGEYAVFVFVRRHSHNYANERNGRSVPPGRIAAERVVWNGA
jgi:hypothetical protein